MAGRAPRTLTPPQKGETPNTPQRTRCRILIIEARFNEKIADELARGAIEEIEAQGATWERITVPGALEIPLVLASAVNSGIIPAGAASSRFAGAVALGCVIRGETYHFEIVSNDANHFLLDVATRHCVPIGNGILTVENEAQAIERAKGGRNGKGGDAARACLRLVDIMRQQQGQGA
jgi:6,7-dimethyl-8-ribityllumazine synthase